MTTQIEATGDAVNTDETAGVVKTVEETVDVYAWRAIGITGDADDEVYKWHDTGTLTLPRWPTPPRVGADTMSELETMRRAVDEVSKVPGHPGILFNLGNHDDRVRQRRTSSKKASAKKKAVSAAAAGMAGPLMGIAFTVKAGDVVTARVANIKHHPENGVLVKIKGNPMAFMLNDNIACTDFVTRSARRTKLIANPGTEITVAVLHDPIVKMVGGHPVGRLAVSEFQARIKAERAPTADQVAARAERTAAAEAAVKSLVIGSVVRGNCFGNVAVRRGKGKRGPEHVFGLFVDIGSGVSGLLHVSRIAGEMDGLQSIIEAGFADVEIVEAQVHNGRPRIVLSHRPAG